MHNLPPFLQFFLHALNPFIVVGLFFLLTHVHQIAFECEYLVLAALAFSLSMQVMEGIDLDNNLKQYMASSVGWIFLRWLLVVALLALIGYACKCGGVI